MRRSRAARAQLGTRAGTAPSCTGRWRKRSQSRPVNPCDAQRGGRQEAGPQRRYRKSPAQPGGTSGGRGQGTRTPVRPACREILGVQQSPCWARVKAVPDAHGADPAGLLQAAKNPDNRTSRRRACRIMKPNGVVVQSPARAKGGGAGRMRARLPECHAARRPACHKRCPHEGAKPHRIPGRRVRRRRWGGALHDATSDNAATELSDAVKPLGAPAAILPYDGRALLAGQAGRSGRLPDPGPVRERAARTQRRIDRLKAPPSPNPRQARTIPPESGERDLAPR